MTGFYMKCNSRQKWVDVVNFVMNLYKVQNKVSRTTLIHIVLMLL